MEAFLGEDIITTPLEACEKYKQIQYVVLRVYARSNEEISEYGPQYSENATLERKQSYPKVA